MDPKLFPNAEAEQNLEIEQRNRERRREELYKAKSQHSNYKEDIKEKDLLARWPKFLDLQVKLPDPGEAATLVEMRKMRPGKAASKEDIEGVCWERLFRTPKWLGRRAGTDIPGRVLSPAEVHGINDKYLKLNAAMLKRKDNAHTNTL